MAVRRRADRSYLFVLLLMAILSQSFLSLVRRNFMTLTLFTTRHVQCNFIVKKINDLISRWTRSPLNAKSGYADLCL